MALVGLLVAGCSSSPSKVDRPENPFKTAQEGPGGAKSPLSDRELRQQASELYRHAREALENADYSVAITRYDALIARYPFSDYSTQAELEKIYTQYKSYQFDDAVTAADRFLRAHPRHPAADYVMYLKGVTDFNRDQGVLDTLMPNGVKRDISNQTRAFEDFALLAKRFPNSRYIGDARRRMLYSRNRIASHQLSVAEFYVSRGAYIAAAKRASDIISEYPGAPATADALKILERSYAKAGLEQEAKDTAALIAMNSDTVTYTDGPKPGVVDAPPEPVVAEAQSKHKHGHKSDTASAAAPVAAAPPPADNAATPPAAPVMAQATEPNGAAANSAAGTAPAQTSTSSQGSGDSKGFFGWFTGLFSFLDFGKHASSSPSQQPPDVKSGAASNSDTTK